MPTPFQPQTLYDMIGAMGGGVNLGDTPTDLPPNVMAGAINTTVSGKLVTHRPCYQRRVVTYVNVTGQISPTQTAVEQGVFQGCTRQVCLDDSGNAFVIALISGRVFSFAIVGNTITATELLIYSGTGSTPQPGTGGYVTATIANAIVSGATISMGGTYTGVIVGSSIASAVLNGQLITGGTVTQGVIISSANVSTPITSATISTGYVSKGTITGAVLPSSGTGAAVVTGPSAVQPQAWLWQNELWVIIEDGSANPIIVNLNTQVAMRSNYGVPVPFPTTTNNGGTGFIIPVIGATGNLTLTSAGNLTVIGTVITIKGFGKFKVTDISSNTATILNVSAATAGQNVPDGTAVTWINPGAELPPGRMGAYGLGRTWLCLTDGRSFIAGDLVVGASGTPTYNFRDAVLNVTENDYIVGGGAFIIPERVGSITAMCFIANLNLQLGQGPLMVFTHNSVYSCQAPVDRLTWQSLTNPILTQALIANGAKGHNSTVLANGDVLFRSVDGIRSLILAQLDFDTWGNVPCSFEVGPVLDLDSQDALNFGSAIVFQNRLLHTVSTAQSGSNYYFAGLVPLNFDPISSLRGKAPAVWDAGVWVGSGPTSQMNVLQLLVGEVSETERAFAFTLNTTQSPNRIEFWEILADNAATADNDGTNDIPISWQFDTASLRFGVDKRDHKAMFLSNGEMWIDKLIGTVTFQVLYKPDLFPCWTPWAAWQTCQTADASDSQPGFLPRMGFGSPSAAPCDTSTGRPMRQGFTFQLRHIIQGHCVFMADFLESQTVPIPSFAKMVCTPLCPTS